MDLATSSIDSPSVEAPHEMVTGEPRTPSLEPTRSAASAGVRPALPRTDFLPAHGPTSTAPPLARALEPRAADEVGLHAARRPADPSAATSGGAEAASGVGPPDGDASAVPSLAVPGAAAGQAQRDEHITERASMRLARVPLHAADEVVANARAAAVTRQAVAAPPPVELEPPRRPAPAEPAPGRGAASADRSAAAAMLARLPDLQRDLGPTETIRFAASPPAGAAGEARPSSLSGAQSPAASALLSGAQAPAASAPFEPVTSESEASRLNRLYEELSWRFRRDLLDERERRGELLGGW